MARQHILLFVLPLIIAMLGFPPAAEADVRVESLRCEYMHNPIGVESKQPRLSWTLASEQRGERQTAYQVLVASALRRLHEDQGDVWDSGKVDSEQSLNIHYAGSRLTSAMRCWWKVRVWDAAGEPSEWSEAAFWEMGLLKAEDWEARWIRAPDALDPSAEPDPAPLLRTTFQIDKPVVQARLYVCGLGYHECYLNGEKVGDQVLSPVFTRYDRRACYLVHDVTARLRHGANAIGAILGNGWYNQYVRELWQIHRAAWRDRPKLLCQMVIEFTDGTWQTVVSGPDWRVAHGPIRYDAVRNGETYDARLEEPGWASADYDDTDWLRAAPAAAPGGVLASP